MAKEKLTENKAERTPIGGVLVGKRNGQTMIHNKGSLSGYLVGKTHAEGGIEAVNEATGQALEMQGGEVVITAPAVSDQTKREFEGKMMTNREILSEINSRGGGVSFAEGGDIPKSLKYTGANYKYGGKTMSDHDIYIHINKGHLAKGKTLKQIAKIHGTTLLDINKQVKMGLKAESEHTSSKREQLKIVKDHLVENPEYYTLLKKAGLKKGGQVKEDLVKDAKSGNTPARDLNNYNDVLDLEADGVIAGDNGLAFANGGDLSEIDTYFDLGGGVGLPKVAYVKVSNAGTSLNGLIYNKYNSYIEFVESVEYAYKQLGRDVRSFVELTAFDENDTKLIECSTYISNQKNTIKNFNPLTGNYKNLEKSLSNSRPINFKKYNWEDWLTSKVKPSMPSASTTNSTVNLGEVPDKIDPVGGHNVLKVKQLPAVVMSLLRIRASEQGFGDINFEDFVNEIRNKKNGKVFQFDKTIEGLGFWSKISLGNFLEFKYKYGIYGEKVKDIYSTPISQSTQSVQSNLLTDLSNTKIWIGDNPELSKKVQEKAFELGWDWGEKNKTVKELNARSLWFNTNNEILHTDDKSFFDNNKSRKEIFASDLFDSSAASQPQTAVSNTTDTVKSINFMFYNPYTKKQDNARVWDIQNFVRTLQIINGAETVSVDFEITNDNLDAIAKRDLQLTKDPKDDWSRISLKRYLNPEILTFENALETLIDLYPNFNWDVFGKGISAQTQASPAKPKLGIVDGFNLEFVIATGSIVSLEYYSVSELLQKIVSVYDSIGINLVYLKLIVEGQIMNTTAESFLIGKSVGTTAKKEINTDTISSKELLLKLEKVYPNWDFSKLDEGSKSKSTQPSQTSAPLTAEQKLVNEFVADDSELRKNDLLGSGSLQQDRNDLDALSKLLPSFQQSKFAVEKASIVKEMFRIQKKIAYKGFIASNEEVSKGADLFTPQGLLHYYFTQTTQNPTAELQPACELPTPNGAKSKLPMSAYLNVRSTQFKKWFGDWEKAYETDNYINCSKMIDEETKEPKIFFHGVRKYIPSFGQMSNMGSGVVRPYGSFEPPNFPASYFANNEDYANFYGGIAENMPKPSPDYKPFIYKVFLNIKNPISLLPLDFEVSYRDLIDYVLVAYGVRLSVNKVLLSQLENDMDKKRPMWVYIRRDIGLIETLKDYGYDALIQQGDIPVFDKDGQVVSDRSKFIKDTEYLSFYPDQVKSATVKKSFYFNFFNDIRFKKGGYVRI
jgi:hypothetical protein